MSAANVANGWYRFASDPPDTLRFWNGDRWSKPHLLPAEAFPHRPAPANINPDTEAVAPAASATAAPKTEGPASKDVVRPVDSPTGVDSAQARTAPQISTAKQVSTAQQISTAPKETTAQQANTASQTNTASQVNDATPVDAVPAIPERPATPPDASDAEPPSLSSRASTNQDLADQALADQTLRNQNTATTSEEVDRRLDWNRAFRTPDDAPNKDWSERDEVEAEAPASLPGFGRGQASKSRSPSDDSNSLRSASGQPDQQVRMRTHEREERAQKPATTPAPLERRLAARFVDSVIEWTIFLAILLASSPVSVGHRRFFAQLPGRSTAPAVWSILAAMAAFFVWEMVWLSWTGSTPGKRLFGLVVRDNRSKRIPPGPMSAAVRTGVHLFYGIPGVGFIVWVASSALNALVAVFDRTRYRSVMDRLGGTQVVVDKRPEAARRTGSLAAFVFALTACVLALAAWQSFHKPAIDESAAVLENLRSGNLAEATAAFAPACEIDRADFAEFFSTTQIVDYELDQAQIDWAVPLFSDADQATLAVVKGTVVLSSDRLVEEPLRILMVHDEGWKVCRFLGE